ncbi:MAG: hypothetical protein U1C73_02150 [Dietzia sp.]|nr:hypothetical protein [Dietzia sp.]
MKKTGLVGVIAGALFAGVIGVAGPAQADRNGYGFSGGGNDFGYGYNFGSRRDRSNNPWLNQLYPSVRVPQVDTSVRN